MFHHSNSVIILKVTRFFIFGYFCISKEDKFRKCVETCRTLPLLGKSCFTTVTSWEISAFAAACGDRVAAKVQQRLLREL